MKARVVKLFEGVRDGELYPRRFEVADVVEGDLARVAIDNKWATEVGAPADGLPDGWEQFNAADMVALARRLGAPEDVKTKAAAVEFIKAKA